MIRKFWRNSHKQYSILQASYYQPLLRLLDQKKKYVQKGQGVQESTMQLLRICLVKELCTSFLEKKIYFSTFALGPFFSLKLQMQCCLIGLVLSARSFLKRETTATQAIKGCNIITKIVAILRCGIRMESFADAFRKWSGFFLFSCYQNDGR